MIGNRIQCKKLTYIHTIYRVQHVMEDITFLPCPVVCPAVSPVATWTRPQAGESITHMLLRRHHMTVSGL